jgi:hypothetical protein
MKPARMSAVRSSASPICASKDKGWKSVADHQSSRRRCGETRLPVTLRSTPRSTYERRRREVQVMLRRLLTMALLVLVGCASVHPTPARTAPRPYTPQEAPPEGKSVLLVVSSPQCARSSRHEIRSNRGSQMPSQKFAFESEGPTRLELTWKGQFKNVERIRRPVNASARFQIALQSSEGMCLRCRMAARCRSSCTAGSSVGTSPCCTRYPAAGLRHPSPEAGKSRREDGRLHRGTPSTGRPGGNTSDERDNRRGR